MHPDFAAFFQTATGNNPDDFPCGLAGAHTVPTCTFQLISVPTGLGKAAAVVLA